MKNRLATLAAIGISACGNQAETIAPAPSDPPTETAMTDTPPTETAMLEAPTGAGGGEGATAGAVVTDDSFELRATATGPYAAGAAGAFGITLTPRPGWHVNQEYPIRVALTAPSGVTLPKSELVRADAAEFAEARARFDVPFTATAAGQHTVQANVQFAVCTPENCMPDERTLAVLLPVQ